MAHESLLAVFGKACVSCLCVHCLDEDAKATSGSVTMQAHLWLMYRLEVKGSDASLVDTLLQTSCGQDTSAVQQAHKCCNSGALHACPSPGNVGVQEFVSNRRSGVKKYGHIVQA